MEKHERLKSARQARRLSQEVVAKAGGIKQSQLSRMEKGQVWASNEVLKKLASFLGIPLSALLDINITQPAEASRRTDTPAMIAKNSDLPVGLRELAGNPEMVKQFAISPYEWHFLSTLQLPHPTNSDGYLSLLILMRAVVDK